MSNLVNKVNNDVNLFTESINVIVRCRGRAHSEREKNSPNVVVIPDNKLNEIKIILPEKIQDENSTAKNDPLNQTTSRVYTLDKVYGPTTDQLTFFQNAAENICNDFLKGFNCTIFAYGQTGAGKTYTMCGKIKDNSLTSESGLIPRSLKKLFDSENQDIILKCSFVEIYNEVLRDLLSDGKNDKLLKIYEHNKNIKINSLEEFYIKDFNEGMKLFKLGLDRKKIASTKMNDVSSRSHTIFTIYLIKKKLNGSEYQFSKMNLVDLAGSENIGRSGSMNQRAREAGSINQSLLTLGRVINSLVDGSSFIPYRESKLTRLLQDSLGGKTKTILVANIAPTLNDLQSSISTLEYASKAKNIQNSAQIGASISEEYLLNELIEENRRLKLDLMATRRRENCIVMDDSNYKEMYLSQKTLKEEVDELRGFRLSLLNQLENQMKEIDSNRKEKQILNQNIQELEMKLVVIENESKKQKENETFLKNKCNDLYQSFSEEIKNAYESQLDTRSILSNKILNCLIEINSKISITTTTDDTQYNGVRQLLKNITTDIKELSNIDVHLTTTFEELKNKLAKLASEIADDNATLSNRMSDYSSIISSYSSSNDEFAKYIKNSLFIDESRILTIFQNEFKNKVHQFKTEFNSKVDELIKENLDHNYNSIRNHYQTKLLNKETEWINNIHKIKDQEITAKNSIIQILDDNRNNLKSIVTNCIKDAQSGEFKVKQIQEIINLAENNMNPLIENINKINEQKISQDKVMNGKISYVKENIKNLEVVINDVVNNNNLTLEKQRDNTILKMNNIFQNKENNNHANVLALLDENQILVPTSKSTVNKTPLKTKSSPIKSSIRSPVLNSIRSPIRSHMRSPIKSPARSPTRSPVQTAFGLKRHSSIAFNTDLKRRNTDL
jgi:kinesin family protein 11